VLISDGWREQNAELHRTNEGFGSKPSRARAERLKPWLKKADAKTVLDYGCGKAWLATYLRKTHDVRCYDPAIPEFAHLPSPADFLVCWDVLEHIEPQALDDVLTHIASLAPAAHFTIGLQPDRTKLMPDGRNPHLILEPPEWWLAKLRPHWPRMNGTISFRILEVFARRDANSLHV